jgi:hypothetical protein
LAEDGKLEKVSVKQIGEIRMLAAPIAAHTIQEGN